MDQTQTSSIRWPLAVLLLAILASTVQPSNAADNEIEREHLAALIRQLDLAQKLATHAADTASPSRSRYHFDYDRLQTDLQRVKSGLQYHLTPVRAQPRDSVEFPGDYSHEGRSSRKAGPSP